MDTDERESRALARLYEQDQQVRDARPDPAVRAAIAEGGFSRLFTTVVEGYADRPALGERATVRVTDPASGRTTSRRLPRFDTVTYRDLGGRVEAVAAERHRDGLRENDLVALLGMGSVDFTTALLACSRLAATAVPLPANAALTSLAAIIEETGPRIIAANTVFDTDDEAVGIANGTAYGLTAAIITTDHFRAGRLADRLAAGMIFVNNYTRRSFLGSPFGGVKGSGFGRENWAETLHEFVRAKNVRFPSGRAPVPVRPPVD